MEGHEGIKSGEKLRVKKTGAARDGLVEGVWRLKRGVVLVGWVSMNSEPINTGVMLISVVVFDVQLYM